MFLKRTLMTSVWGAPEKVRKLDREKKPRLPASGACIHWATTRWIERANSMSSASSPDLRRLRCEGKLNSPSVVTVKPRLQLVVRIEGTTHR